MTLPRLSCVEPVIVHLGDPSADGLDTPWGVPGGVAEDPEKPGHFKADHLMFIDSDWIEHLLAKDAPVLGSMNCLIHATRDGGRVFFHVWAPNGDHWVWQMHECIYRFGYPEDYVYDDQSDDPVRTLLGCFPD